jgi:hypothetical protein
VVVKVDEEVQQVQLEVARIGGVKGQAFTIYMKDTYRRRWRWWRWWWWCCCSYFRRLFLVGFSLMYNLNIVR